MELQKETLSRRSLLIGAAAGGACMITPGLVHAQAAATAPALAAGDVVLFQGDSITDAGRNKDAADANNPGALAGGYAMMIASRLLGVHSGLRLQCYNRGISGNKVPDLDARWQADTIALKPRVLSILIGVNDMWHKLSGKYDGTVDQYEKGFAALLAKTVQAVPGVTLVICEPFVLRCGAVNETWFPEFDQRREAAKRVAELAGAIWVPFQSMFDAAITADTPPEYWAGDGVHPTMAGHALMAKTWLDTTGLG
ncbi:MAG: SGNH/GDSL hydrolase family protein [Candidatus Hydrogenedentes bacterium]|nr:SGNH/GDSL hydrolase family protein [Candidatus Hydrogenedentota bacterium]